MRFALHMVSFGLEAVMKAVLALVVIYVVAFLVAIQGSAPAAVEASPQSAAAKPAAAHSSAIDPAKEADIRSLLDLVGARDQVQESVNYSAEQYREKLLATIANNDKNQAFVNAVITDYEKKFDVDQVTEQLVAIYDKHYSSEEIKELLQFYGSPMGQRVATEAPKISREIQAATRATAAKAVKDALQETKEENPVVGQNAHLTTAPARRFQQPRTTQDATQAAQQQDQP
jgi:hypothetical protein